MQKDDRVEIRIKLRRGELAYKKVLKIQKGYGVPTMVEAVKLFLLEAR